MRDNKDQFLDFLNKKAPSYFSEITKAMKEDGKEHMALSFYETLILDFFIKITKVKSVLEIGSLYARSTLMMAQSVGENGKIYSIEKNEDHFKKACLFVKKSSFKKRVHLIHGDAREVLNDLKDKSFDLIFIDANKSSYPIYLDWADKNMKKGSFIIGDNVFLFGHLLGKDSLVKVSSSQIKAMESFNQRLQDPKFYHSSLLPTKEGMMIAQKLF